MRSLRLLAALFLALSPIVAAAPASAQSSGWEWCAVNWSADPTVCESLLNGNTGSVTYPNPSWVYFGHNSGYTGTPISGFTVSHSGVLEWWYTIDGTNWIDGNVTDYSPQTFTCPDCVGIKFSNQTGGAQIYRVTIELAATPTPTPVASSTPAPQSQACIPSAAIPTATPRPLQATPTPFGTWTPAPGTPIPSATPIPSWTDFADFSTGLGRWTSNGSATLAAGPGPDNQQGVAVLPFTSGATVSADGQTQNYAPNDALILEHQDMPVPWRISGDLRTSEGIPSGTHAYLQVFAWIDGGLGTGAWQLVGSRAVSQAWGTWTYYAAVTQTRAIALRAVLGLGQIDNPLGFIPQDSSIKVWVDNLRVVAGRDANSPAANRLPVCTGNTALASTQTKVCTVNIKTVDVLSQCKMPSSITDIGGWIAWVWCRLSAYFTFTNENRKQVDDMRLSQSEVLPFGLIYDITPALNSVSSTVQGVIGSMSSLNGDTPWWDQLYNIGSQANPAVNWDTPPQLKPVEAKGCTDNIPGLNGNTLRAACTVIRTARDNSPVLKIGEWMFNVSMFFLLWTYIQRKWMATNK